MEFANIGLATGGRSFDPLAMNNAVIRGRTEFRSNF